MFKSKHSGSLGLNINTNLIKEYSNIVLPNRPLLYYGIKDFLLGYMI